MEWLMSLATKAVGAITAVGAAVLLWDALIGENRIAKSGELKEVGIAVVKLITGGLLAILAYDMIGERGIAIGICDKVFEIFEMGVACPRL